jgi:hypothetical protein
MTVSFGIEDAGLIILRRLSRENSKEKAGGGSLGHSPSMKFPSESPYPSPFSFAEREMNR